MVSLYGGKLSQVFSGIPGVGAILTYVGSCDHTCQPFNGKAVATDLVTKDHVSTGRPGQFALLLNPWFGHESCTFTDDHHL